MNLESFRGLLYEIRDLSIGGAMYASNISSDKIDGPFNLAMYNIIARNANTILGLIEQKIELQYGVVDDV